jgi:hypothetical protein
MNLQDYSPLRVLLVAQAANGGKPLRAVLYRVPGEARQERCTVFDIGSRIIAGSRVSIPQTNRFR